MNEINNNNFNFDDIFFEDEELYKKIENISKNDLEELYKKVENLEINEEEMKNILDILSIEKKPISKELHSVYEGGLFSQCIDCGENLLDNSLYYEIQKVYKGREVIFEYAICYKCGLKLKKEYSKESNKAINKFLTENFRTINPCKCSFCERDIIEVYEYSHLAICKGAFLINDFKICEKCLEEIEKVLSKKTRDRMKDFIKEKFPGIPADISPVTTLKV